MILTGITVCPILRALTPSGYDAQVIGLDGSKPYVRANS